MNYLGIDFSKNSTGVTLYKNNIFYFFSFCRDYKINSHKKSFKHHNNLSTEINDISVIDYSLLDTNNKNLTYSEREINKIKNGRTIAKSIINELNNFLSKEEWENTVCIIEGYSYGSKGNILIDLVTMTSILKDYIFYLAKSEVIIYSPTQIKSIATNNGRSSKEEMFLNFIKDNSFESSFKNYCKNIKIEKSKVPKPLDDVIDSYFVLKTFLISNS